MPPPSRIVRLDDALELPGCPLCRVVLQRVEQSMESISYELVLDPAARERLDSAWGFCNVHAQQWLDHASPLATAILYEAVLGRVSSSLERNRQERTAGGGLRSRLKGTPSNIGLVPTGECWLCGVRAEHEELIASQLLDELKTINGQERFFSSDGLCVVHMNTVLTLGPDTDALDLLRRRMQATQQKLQEQLREIIRKHDYRYQHEAVGDERDAPHRAVRQVAGAAGLGRSNS